VEARGVRTDPVAPDPPRPSHHSDPSRDRTSPLGDRVDPRNRPCLPAAGSLTPALSPSTPPRATSGPLSSADADRDGDAGRSELGRPDGRRQSGR
jgi:hypothetical protein